MKVTYAGYQSGSKSRFTEKVVPQEGGFFNIPLSSYNTL